MITKMITFNLRMGGRVLYATKGLLCFVCLSVFFLWGCGHKENVAEISGLLSERDSLQQVSKLQKQQLEDINSYFSEISECLDSITEQEKILLVSVDPETNHRYSRTEMRHRLNLLSDIISRQRERIQELTDSLYHNKDNKHYNNLSKMVDYLSQQIDVKEARINSLLAEVNNKNKDIARLTASVNDLQTQVIEAKEKNEMLATAVVQQTKMLNETYVLIGDKKKLQEAGVLTKGNLLKKSKFNPDNINLSNCQAVDISMVREIPLNSKKPKILSAVPSSSYSIVDNGNGGKTLIIKDATSFWSLSNILVIQL